MVKFLSLKNNNDFRKILREKKKECNYFTVFFSKLLFGVFWRITAEAYFFERAAEGNNSLKSQVPSQNLPFLRANFKLWVSNMEKLLD